MVVVITILQVRTIIVVGSRDAEGIFLATTANAEVVRRGIAGAKQTAEPVSIGKNEVINIGEGARTKGICRLC